MPKVADILSGVNGALQILSTSTPILLGAYTAFKAIWLATNPGKTEADFISYLATVSADDAAADETWLTAHGYANVNGNWVKAPVVVPPPPVVPGS